MKSTDILIIGAGAAGMGTALSAIKSGHKVIIADRQNDLGGILLQCSHKGFGLGYFKENLTGQEYALKFKKILMETAGSFEASCKNLELLLNTSVTRIGTNKIATLSGPNGTFDVGFEKLIVATGCREKSIYSTHVAGTRPAGVITCGQAQRLINVCGHKFNGRVIILGTGDIGQIVARDLINNGAEIISMIEQSNSIGGLRRNQMQCIDACNIPVILNSTITRIEGYPRITRVQVKNLITNELSFIDCDYLMTAIGLIPELDIAADLDPWPDWVFKCGNCDYVHEIVDTVTTESISLGAFL